MNAVVSSSPNTIFNDIWESVDLKMRTNLNTFSSNQNMRTLFQILIKRPHLLTKYDRKRGVYYILNCIKK